MAVTHKPAQIPIVDALEAEHEKGRSHEEAKAHVAHQFGIRVCDVGAIWRIYNGEREW